MIRLATIAARLAAAGHVVHADDYPSKPVRLISGFQPGGGSDIVARLLADRLSERWGKPFIVDNRSGAGGTIAMGIAAKAPADGYTLLVISGSQIINAAYVTKVPFDILKAYAPITQATSGPYLIAAHPSVPVANVKELVSLAKAKPAQLTYASSGTGSSAHLGMELFKSVTGTDLVHVPYKGSGPALIDLIGGQVNLAMASTTSSMPHVRSGKLRAIAVTTLQRSPLTPEIPSVAEQGVRGYSVDSWYGLVAPAATPQAIVQRLNAEIANILATPAVVSHLAKEGSSPKPGSPSDLAQTIRGELAKWRKVISSAHIKVE